MSQTIALPEAAPVPAKAAAPVRTRFDSIDILRGLVMVIMALDHTRNYFSNVRTYGPENLYASSFPLFLTRWITHFCAPTFVFLAGTGAFIYGSRVRSKKELSWFLFSRGLWLVFLELTWVRWSWNFTFEFMNNAGPVIWAIGWSMVALSVLVFLPTWIVAYFGVVMICVHNCFDSVQPEDWNNLKWLPENCNNLGWLWTILHSGGRAFSKEISPQEWGPFAPLAAFLAKNFSVSGTITFDAAYPLIPWIGVMAVGYGFGSFFLLDRSERRRWFWVIGLSLTLAFVVLRASRGYGDRDTWPLPNEAGAQAFQHQMDAMHRPVPPRQMSDTQFAICSFLNCTKYPPSFLYLLMTLGPSIMVLALFDRESTGPLGRFFLVFGRVPLFYYLLHLPLIHGLMFLCDVIRYHRNPYEGDSFWSMDPVKLPPGYGYSLPIVFLVWIGVVLILYPLCRWYGDYKRRHRSVWLSYL
jgi:uncharacterized membrane protein